MEDNIDAYLSEIKNFVKSNNEENKEVESQ